MNRLPATKSLSDKIPAGAEGGKEFARIVDLLLFHRSHKTNDSLTLFDDSAGDYAGLDSLTHSFRKSGTIGFQYKFFRSPLKPEHRRDIEESLKRAILHANKSRLTRWILVTPDDFTQPATRTDGGDVAWFEDLKQKYKHKATIEHWGHKALQGLFLETPSLCLHYYPELHPQGEQKRKTFEDTQKRYTSNLDTKYRKIQFVGMSVYKPEATKGVAMEHIYIPLRLAPESANSDTDKSSQINPLTLLATGTRHVVLGDPGSGKSTLLRFLALVGQTKSLQQRFKANPDHNRLPIIITLRRYADDIKTRPNLPLIDHIIETTQADFSLKAADLSFFEYYLESGNALLCFDGLDELPSPQFKQIIRDRIRGLLSTYPGNTCLITSRIVGYDNSIRLDETFQHHKVARLDLDEINQFIADWYTAREDNKKEREQNVKHLCSIINNPEHQAIRDLAYNPLLLTIIALVHRIDAVLPDERVVLYQKCTETLLNTWHTWKNRDTDDNTSRNKTERRNRSRIEALAHWMHERSLNTQSGQRAIVPFAEAKEFLANHIRRNERSLEREADAEDAADSFFEFVKARAGLLIEVGDQQYSFVHLTFQEYLTSAHIATQAEHGGSPALWDKIKNNTSSPRWEEAIRLLVASLRSEESRAYILDNLTTQFTQAPTPTRASLLLGCLIDGTDQAEARSELIIELAIATTVQCVDPTELPKLVSKLRLTKAKSAPLEKVIKRKISENLQNSESENQRAVILTAATLGLPIDPFLRQWSHTPSQCDEWIRLLLHRVPKQAVFTQSPNLPTDYFDSLLRSAAALSLHSPTGNLIAFITALFPLAESLDSGLKYILRLLLSNLAAHGQGPFEDAVFNIFLLNILNLRRLIPENNLRAIERRFTGAPNADGEFRMRSEQLASRTIKLVPTPPRRKTPPLVRRLFERIHSTTVFEEFFLMQKNIWGEFRFNDPYAGCRAAIRTPSIRLPTVDLAVQNLLLTPPLHWQEALDSCFVGSVTKTPVFHRDFDLLMTHSLSKEIPVEADQATENSFAIASIIETWLWTRGTSAFSNLIMANAGSHNTTVQFFLGLHRFLVGESPSTDFILLRDLSKELNRHLRISLWGAAHKPRIVNAE